MSISNQANYSKIIKYGMLGIFLLFVLVLNYKSFVRHIASNSQSINNYEIPEEYVERTRPSVVAGLFYPTSAKEAQIRYERFIGKRKGSEDFEHRPELFVIPHAGYQYSAAVATETFQTLAPYAKDINNVIFVAPAHNQIFPGAGILKRDNLAGTPINQEVAASLSEAKSFRYYSKAFVGETVILEQLSYLQKALPQFNIIPVLYSQITAEDLAQALIPYTKRNDTVVIISADLANYYTGTQNPLSESEDEHLDCGKRGIEAALKIAQSLNLTPKTIDLVNAEQEMKQFEKYSAYELDFGTVDKTSSPSIEKEQKSLQDFASVHGKYLMQIAERTLTEFLESNHQYKPSRKDYNNVLFNRGATYVLLFQNKELIAQNGHVLPSQGVSLDVAENTYNAAKTILDKNLNFEDLKITILLITDIERIKYKDEQDLLNKLDENQDGVILRSGNRQAIFLPQQWKNYESKQAFLNDLKFKAGLNPSYWSNQINIYKFYTVEIEEDAN